MQRNNWDCTYFHDLCSKASAVESRSNPWKPVDLPHFCQQLVWLLVSKNRGWSGQFSPKLTRSSYAESSAAPCVTIRVRWLSCCPGAVVDAGSSARVPHPSPWGSGRRRRWKEPGTSLPLSGTQLCSVTKNVCFSRVGADLSDLVMANLLFSVLCNLGLVNIKAAVLTFSSHIVLVFFSHGLSAEKEKQVCYLQSYSAPTAG